MLKIELKPRDLYLKQLISFQDLEPIKVITGIRRCGKSSLLLLMQEHLIKSGVSKEQIISINFESMQFMNMTYEDLYAYVKQRITTAETYYLFFDEIQKVDRWEDAINSFRVDFDCDIYLTGSNAYLLSSEYSTFLSGRYVEIKVLPLSFKEFLLFRSYSLEEYTLPFGVRKKRLVDSSGMQVDLQDVFKIYTLYGGMPSIALPDIDQNRAMTILDGIYSTVVLKDILNRKKHLNKLPVQDPELLKRLVMFLADNVGNSTSIRSIARTLDASPLFQIAGNPKPSIQTITSYVRILQEVFLFYSAKRFDIKGKEYLRALDKYYIVDPGLKNCLLGFKDQDKGHMIENIVYFELLRRGYDVAIGRIDTLEVDFIARKNNERLYVQVTESMAEEATKDREFKPLQKIDDNYKKMILTLNPSLTSDYQGIEVVDLIQWLVE